MKLYLALGISLLMGASAFADGQVAPLGPADQKAFRNLIGMSECAYAGPWLRVRRDPEIQKVASSCGGKPEYICESSLYCVNSVSSFYVERAFCWSNDNTGVRCPPANTCARQAFFDQVANSRDIIAPKELQESSGLHN